MRIDHYAYQRGTRVAGFGLLLQFLIGLVLLVFGWNASDTTFTFASIYVLAGLPIWLSLIIVFHQHKLERLEALEEDELSAGRVDSSSIFESRPDEQRVAARRLAMMHKWLMPSVSLAVAIFLGLMAWWQFKYMDRLTAALDTVRTTFHMTEYVGWGIAICLGFALIAFIFSRFVAGMAKLPAWQSLRGGAGYMVGTSLLLLIVAVGLGFRVFNNDDVIRGIARWAIWIYMAAVAFEIVLNFVLNLYRPRIPGEVPRPAFDSRVLSLLAAPDSIVKSVNEAVNYQFGFDITSSWGYQLLLRSFVWLIGLGVVAMVLLNTMVVVEPHQQAVKLSFGKRVGEVYGSGIMWKLPWPFETARVYDVAIVEEVNLTARRREQNEPHLWTDSLDRGRGLDRSMDPFIVGSTVVADSVEREAEFLFMNRIEQEPLEEESETERGDRDATDETDDVQVALQPAVQATQPVDAATVAVSRAYALVDAEMTLQYRIRGADRPKGGGLLAFLEFVPDTPTREPGYTTRDKAIRAIAMREITQYLASLPIDDVLSQRRSIASELRERVQGAMDERNVGIEVLAVNVPLVRPSGDAAQKFEEVGGAAHARREIVAKKQGQISDRLTELVGDPAAATEVLRQLDELERIEREHGRQSPEAIEHRLLVERLLRGSGGSAARMLARAESERWSELMNQRISAIRTRSQSLAYQASPSLYREREMMRILGTHLGTMRKYIIGVDPSRIRIDADLRELSPLVDLSPALGDDEGDSN